MILVFKRFRGGGAIRAFFLGGGPVWRHFQGRGGEGGAVKNTLYGCCMDAVLSHVIMRMTRGGLLV